MGIKFLMSFLKDHYGDILVPVKLAALQSLVVDGNSLCHYLYYSTKCDWQLGGEYPEFCSKVEAYFELIRASTVEPIVIFDGSQDQRKTETIIKRKEEKNKDMLRSQKGDHSSRSSVAPLLMLQTFMDVLEDMKIEFHIAPSEGDKEVAAVANARGCPVLSNDSDFFMYDLSHGFILFEHLNTTTQQCLLYHLDKFNDFFGLKDSKLRLFLPVLHGNDFITPPAELGTRKSYTDTIKMISKYNSSKKCMAEKFENAIMEDYEAAEKQYCNPQSIPYEHQKAAFISTYSLPEWTFDSFLRGTFDPHLLNVLQHNFRILGNVVEDISMQSAWVCSRPIRQYYYGFVGCVEEVNEYIRDDHEPSMGKTSVAVKCTSPPVRLSDFQDQDRKELVLSVLDCTDAARNMQEFKKLDEKWKLPLATVRFWYHNSEFVNDDLMKALLFCFLHCSGEQVHRGHIPRKSNLWALHVFGQWQCVYYDAMILNNTARTPFLFTSPSVLFSGQAALYFAYCIKSGIKSLNTKVPLFEIMLNFVKYQNT